MMRSPAMISSILGLFVIAFLAALWINVLVPIRDWKSETESELDQAKAENARLHSSINSLSAEMALASDSFELAGLWDAETLNDGTARVQSVLGALARDSGIALRSIAPAQALEIAEVETVGFRLEAELELGQLTDLLKTIEFHNPLLLVERTNIRRLSRAPTASGQPVLQVQLDVSAPFARMERDE